MRRTTLLCTAGLLAFAMGAGPDGCVPKKKRDKSITSLEVTGAGRSLTRLTNDEAPEWCPTVSPDGKKLVYARTGLSPRRTRMNQVIAGVDPNQASGEQVYTATTAISSHPSFSADGKYLYLVSNTTGGLAIVRTRAVGGGAALRVIVPRTVASAVAYPNLSPDGTVIVFSALMSGKWKIVRKQIDGTGVTVLGEGTQPALSPDGKTIAFVRAVNNYNQIFTMDADSGSNLTQLTKIDRYAVGPAWSPDGNLIAFCSDMGYDAAGGDKNFTRNLYVMNVDGGGITQMTTGRGQADWPFWGKDGFIYFQYAEYDTGAWDDTDIWRLQPVLED